ncbi:DeoR/GlpR transcriptional regulator [Mycetocola manganoxydans]|uniref:DeoR/GlpR transcriptional regulator n=1 Tax=Mycetocola manganoxydans TaxID=699879 RepID=A0A3L6ZW07_9MICO|nr:DeoR/GlpR family DNA-binding transcription regulator [Mycetocola manganoxydans]RLP72077.1 DeoR/GlpR transcriptional regulator [Mycetocola manganoxydans]GHD47836.1 transcriptional regulator [Mycetocola manganoxydans]
MNRAERLTAILDLLAEHDRVDVDDLVGRLAISPATARRDLDLLAEQQLLTRTRGGAVGHSVSYDLPRRYRPDQPASPKERIARAASALIPRGAVVGLCGGTTSTAIASLLTSRADLTEPSTGVSLTIVTNAVNIAVQLAVRPQFKVVVTGGVVHPRSYELVGPYSDLMLREVSLDLAFLGVNGIDPAIGATVHDEGEARINRLMAARSDRAIVVAESSKIGHRAFANVGGADTFSTLITDEGITATQSRAFTEAGIDVIVAT